MSYELSLYYYRLVKTSIQTSRETMNNVATLDYIQHAAVVVFFSVKIVKYLLQNREKLKDISFLEWGNHQIKQIEMLLKQKAFF